MFLASGSNSLQDVRTAGTVCRGCGPARILRLTTGINNLFEGVGCGNRVCHSGVLVGSGILRKTRRTSMGGVISYLSAYVLPSTAACPVSRAVVRGNPPRSSGVKCTCTGQVVSIRGLWSRLGLVRLVHVYLKRVLGGVNIFVPTLCRQAFLNLLAVVVCAVLV